MKNIVVFLFFVTQIFVVNAQAPCKEMQEYLKQRDFDSTAKYERFSTWQFAKQLDKTSNPYCIAFANQLRARVQISNNQLEEAKISLEKEQRILDSIRAKKVHYIENKLTFGELEIASGNYQVAINYYTASLKSIIRTTNNAQISRAFLGLAYAYNKIHDKEKSVYYANLANTRIQQIADNTQKVDLLLQLGNRYLKIYQTRKNKAFLDSSVHVMNYTHVLIRKINYSDSYLNLYNLYGDHAYLSQNYRLALSYLDSALQQTNPTYKWAERGSIYADMADVYLDIKKYDKAYICADSNYFYVKKSNNPFDVVNALELLYTCAKLSGEYERALNVFQDLSFMRDSINKIEKANSYNLLEEKYYRVRKEKSEAEYSQDQQLLKQQKEIGILKKRLILIGSIVLVLLLAYVFMVFRQKKLKTLQKELEAQNRIHKSRINSELIYQALNKIQEGNNTDSNYKKNVSSFTKLLKRAIDSNFNDFMTIEKEIEFLTLYMNFLKENKQIAFTFSFDSAEQVDKKNWCVPALLIQPFIESIVLEGFKDLKKEGHISITFQLKGLNEIGILIEDNGKGLKAVDSFRASQIINDRLYLLNKLNKTNASFFIKERTTGGVQIEIFIPLITKAYADGLLEDYN